MEYVKLLRAIVIREVRDQFRDWRITLPIIFLTSIFPFIIGYVSTQVVQFVQSYDADIIAENLVPFFLLVVGFFPITISLVIAIESFVGEKERKSIEPLLTSPLEDSQLFLGKLIAVMFPPLFGSFIGMAVYLIGAYTQFGFVTGIDLIVLVIFLTVVQAFVMVSAAVVISSQSTTVRAANLLASFIVVPMAFLIQWEAIVMFWGDYKDLWFVVLGLAILAVLFIRVGVTHFNREELIGQEFDRLNIKWMWQVFKSRFVGSAESVRDWYRIEIPETIKELRLAIGLMSLLLIGSWIFGIWQADIYVFPTDLLDKSQLDMGLSSQLGILRLISAETVFYLWFHNIRAMFLGTLLGIFSFGILGVIVLLVPFVLIAYLMIPVTKIGIPFWKYLLGLVIPHGLFEIPAILLVGAAILRIGASLATPSRGESITDGLLRSLADWAKIMFGVVVPLLFVSALVEALITPRLAVWLLAQ